MNSINNIKGLFFGAALLSSSLASCTDGEDNPMAILPTLNVVNVTGTQLKAKGDTIVITLDRTANEIYTTDSWAIIEQDGRKVSISAQPNNSREKRNALIVMKDGEGDSTMVNVSQEGVMLDYSGDRIVVHSYQAKSVGFQYTTNDAERVRIVGQPDWIQAEVKGDSIHLSVASNKKGTSAGPLRMGYVKFGINDMIDSVKVIQYYRTNLRGNQKWALGGYLVTFDEYGSYNINTSQTQFLPADMAFTLGNKAKFTFKEVPLFSGMNPVKFTLLATLDPATMSFSFGNGQFVSNIGDSIYVAETLIGAGFMRTFESTPQCRFVLDVDDAGNIYGRITGEFPYNGSNLDIIGMWFCAFKQEEFSLNYYYGQGRGDLFGFTPCWLMMLSE